MVGKFLKMLEELFVWQELNSALTMTVYVVELPAGHNIASTTQETANKTLYIFFFISGQVVHIHESSQLKCW